jgi:hypothetical protein
MAWEAERKVVRRSVRAEYSGGDVESFEFVWRPSTYLKVVVFG